MLEVSERSLVLDFPITPNCEDLFLILSLSGNRAQIERRTEARRRVLEGRSANPMLGTHHRGKRQPASAAPHP